MIEVELLNIMKKLIENGQDLKPFCEKIIFVLQRQHMALAGVRIGIETRDQVNQATLALVDFMKEQLMPKVPPQESTLEHSFAEKAP